MNFCNNIGETHNHIMTNAQSIWVFYEILNTVYIE